MSCLKIRVFNKANVLAMPFCIYILANNLKKLFFGRSKLFLNSHYCILQWDAKSQSFCRFYWKTILAFFLRICRAKKPRTFEGRSYAEKYSSNMRKKQEVPCSFKTVTINQANRSNKKKRNGFTISSMTSRLDWPQNQHIEIKNNQKF